MPAGQSKKNFNDNQFVKAYARNLIILNIHVTVVGHHLDIIVGAVRKEAKQEKDNQTVQSTLNLCESARHPNCKHRAVVMYSCTCMSSLLAHRAA